MSLIEQAAKRLDELRRAGVPASGSALRDANEEARGDAIPTPEAAVHAAKAPVQAPTSVRPEGVSSPLPWSKAPVSVPHRRFDINLAQLRARGIVTPDAPKSQIADEFRVVKRPIVRNALDTTVKRRNLVMVTSALPGEGKTFTAVNLAMSVAMELDHTVLLVDGDVAHPTLPSLLGMESAPGLLDLLTSDSVDVGDALLRTNVDKLSVLPAGSRQRRATELLASEQMSRLLKELSSRYSDRIIIFDSPPLLPTTEARVLAANMGQIVMVVAADKTTQHTVSQAMATIESCDIVLMLLNKASQSDVGTYYGYYRDDVER